MRRLSELQAVHELLFADYERYQVALMDRDGARAATELATLRARLATHAAVEEAHLMPLFEALHAVQPREGAGPELFAAEHGKLERLGAGLAEGLAGAHRAGEPLDAGVALGLIERGFTFKHLLEHHTQREDRAFYPVLETHVADWGAVERAELWARLDAAGAAASGE